MQEAPDAPSRWTPGIVFGLVVGLQSLLSTPVLFLNDEILQALGLHAMAGGGYAISGDVPAGYAALRDHGFWHIYAPAPGARAAPFGSMPLNILALPALWALRALSMLVGTTPAIAAFAVAGTLVGVHCYGRLRPAQRLSGVGLGVAAAALWAGSFALRPLAFAPFAEVAALQGVSQLAEAGSAALLFSVVRRSHGPRVAAVAALLYAAATPAFIWGGSAKYHGLAMLLCTAALWALRDGHAGPPARTAVAFGCAGLAVWNQLPLGLVLTATLGVLLLPACWQGRLGWARIAAAAGAWFAGVVPYVGQRWLEARLGLGSQYFAQAAHSVGSASGLSPASFGETVRSETSQGLLSHSVFSDPLGVLDSVAQNIVWFRHVPPLSMLCLVPVAVVSAFVLGDRRLRAGVPSTLRWMALLYGALLFASSGRLLLDVGASFDVRHVSTLWPFLVPLLAPALAHAWPAEGLVRLRGAFVGMVLGWFPLALAPLFAVHSAWGHPGPGGVVHDALFLARWVGLALAFWLVWSWVALLRRERQGRAPGLLHWARRLAVALGFSFALQLYIRLGLHNSYAPWAVGPFVVWPIELVARAVSWLVLNPN